MKLVPKNWREFQHYKDRAPPWIRLQRKLLDDRDFHSLPVDSRALAPMLWLLASESIDGSFNADPAELAFRLRQSERDITKALAPLIERKFFYAEQDATTVLAECPQGAVPETETETETDTVQAPERKRSPAVDTVPISELVEAGLEEQTALDFIAHKSKAKAPLTRRAWADHQREASKAGWSVQQAAEKVMAKSWKGFEASYVAKDGRPPPINDTLGRYQ